mmetsp:Transcript_34633/g.98600  ORF Transcript_34633/g.98600 Transcript_34633/m.98600 type:complete len:346 (-) Transcript_34633:2-1039(-)
MLHAVLPLPIVAAAVHPSEHAMTVLLAILVLTCVEAVRGVALPNAVEAVGRPSTLDLPPVGPPHRALALPLVVGPLALVDLSVRKPTCALAMLPLGLVLPLVPRAAGPDLRAAPLGAALPSALVGRPAAVVPAHAVHLPALPLALVDAAVRLREPALAMHLVRVPLACVGRPIWPHQVPLAVPLRRMALAHHPLAGVHAAVNERVGIAPNEARLWDGRGVDADADHGVSLLVAAAFQRLLNRRIPRLLVQCWPAQDLGPAEAQLVGGPVPAKDALHGQAQLGEVWRRDLHAVEVAAVPDLCNDDGRHRSKVCVWGGGVAGPGCKLSPTRAPRADGARRLLDAEAA